MIEQSRFTNCLDSTNLGGNTGIRVWNGLDKLDEWPELCGMQFSKEKHKIIHLGSNNKLKYEKQLAGLGDSSANKQLYHKTNTKDSWQFYKKLRVILGYMNRIVVACKIWNSSAVLGVRPQMMYCLHFCYSTSNRFGPIEEYLEKSCNNDL